MTKVRNFLLCLVLLALAGILHHEWTQMTGSSGIEPEVRAATLGNPGATCNGSAKWHFVNNQTGGACGDLTATFNCDGTVVSQTVGFIPGKCLSSNVQFNVFTTGNCTLVNATTDNPGNLRLSDLSCSFATPTPTPTPSPSPSPSPTV